MDYSRELRENADFDRINFSGSLDKFARVP